MFVSGIILAPAVLATPAVQDLANLRAVINAAADNIGSPQNPNRGWGLLTALGQMGTADHINNITSTVLQCKFQIDTNNVCPFLLSSVHSTDENADRVAKSLG